MPNAPYVDGGGTLRQRSLSSGEGTVSNPDVADFSPKYLNDNPITGVTIPSGGTGIIGWLSAVYQKLITGVAVTGTFSASSLRGTLQYVTGTINVQGNNQIIAAPGAGLSIYITHLVLQNESAVSTTIILRDTDNRLRCLAAAQGSGIALVFPDRGEIKLVANTALNLNLSGNNVCGYSIGYYTGA